jgi:hypothetical protein
VIDFGGAEARRDLDVRWIHGSPAGVANGDPATVHRGRLYRARGEPPDREPPTSRTSRPLPLGVPS